MKLSDKWKIFCRRGRYKPGDQGKSVEKCMAPDGTVRGHYSDLPLDPTLPDTNALYPSHDHTSNPADDSQMVVDARFINDMKSLLSEDEFWMVIEHMYSVGMEKGKINQRSPQRLPSGWRPKRNY